MARTIEGTLNLPDTGPLANAAIWFTAKRNEATKILKGVNAMVATDASGGYSQSIVDGYYAVAIVYAEGGRRAPLGDVFIEAGDPITINALLAVNGSVADPTDAALQQLLADAQAARDQAVAAAASIEVMEDFTDTTPERLVPVGGFGLGATDIPSTQMNSGEADMPTGFYSGGGGGASTGTFPTANSRYFPFVNINRRRTAGDYNQLRQFYDSESFYVRYRDSLSGPWVDQFFGYTNKNILGTVSQLAGVPTGAIIERGSNANGEYVKFADGTMICTHELDAASQVTLAEGSIYMTDSRTWTYPATFAEEPAFYPQVNRTISRCWAGLGDGATLTTQTSFRAFRGTSVTGTPVVRLFAIGRWF